MLREKMLTIIPDTFSDLPVKNSIDDILDNSITKVLLRGKCMVPESLDMKHMN